MDKEMVERGIEINARYQKDLTEKLSPMPLVTQLTSIGFDGLEDFFNQKRIYDMQRAVCGKRYEANPKESLEIFNELIQECEAGIISCPIEENMVYEGKGKESSLNVRYCEENGIEVYPYGSYGGNIVGVKGDYSLGLVVPSTVDITSTFIVRETANMLSEYFPGVSTDGNDILIDNRKVCGTSVGRTDKMLYMTFFFSFNDSAELAEKVCGEPATGEEVGHIDPEVLSMERWKGEFERWLQGL